MLTINSLPSNELSSNLHTTTAFLQRGRTDSVLSAPKTKDDESGLSISMASRDSALKKRQEMMTLNDNVSKILVASGATSEISDTAKRMLGLAESAASGFDGSDNNKALQNEINMLLERQNETSSTTKFVNENLLDGSGSGVGTANLSNAAVFTSPIDITTVEGANKAINTINDGIKKLDSTRESFSDSLEQAYKQFEVHNAAITNTQQPTASSSKIKDVDFAAESADFSKSKLAKLSGSFNMAQANNNISSSNVMMLLQ